ncbi:ABC transporter permease [Labrys monachus]|uniref:Ribose transport system permease protein n=1 Tax=Labrys monachus TaxID=217067 RepID=A0ABU0F8I4_9HYPH|nr:ABC transporter permease [Labrys monachus]MDQ0390925.1 ribose transport system permease protein [Labrys monachus]
MNARESARDGIASDRKSAAAAGPSSVTRKAATIVFKRYATVLLLVVFVVVFAATSPQFLTTANWQNLLVVQAVVSCTAFAAILPLVVGEFDLSLGNMIGFLTMLGAFLSGQGYEAPVVIPVMLLGGVLVGLLNGFLTVYFQISSFIVTLGVGIVLSGFTMGLSGGQVLFDGIPQVILSVGQEHVLGLGITVWLTGIIAALLLYMLEQTPFGRKLYAVGGSERVAFLAGIRTGLLKIAAFAIAGLLTGVGAIFALGQNGAANAGFGPELLLPAYAAVFLGVTTYRPGYYNIPGTLIAILLMAVGFNGLNLLGAPFWVQPIFNGTVLVVAVICARAESSRTK